MNEFDFIDKYLKPIIDTSGAAGLEDDVAILSLAKNPQIVTTDTIVETRHFRATDPWSTIGQKLVRVNVSDCLSKAASPNACLLNITWNRNHGEAALVDFISGLSEDLKMYGISLIGGDTTSHEGPAVFSLTLFGESLRSGGPIQRCSAKVEDDVWVTGTIGDAGLGLEIEEPANIGERVLRARYQVPNLAGISIIDLLSRFASASMDVSDGLLQDAAHICSASSVGMMIELSEIPVSEEANLYLGASNDADTLIRLSSMGDDYQVLFTANPNKRSDILTNASSCNLEVRRIGSVVEGEGVRVSFRGVVVQKELKGGWQHSLNK